MVTVFYILANIAYVSLFASASSEADKMNSSPHLPRIKLRILVSQLLPAFLSMSVIQPPQILDKTYPAQVWGPGLFVTRVISLIIALSAMGNVLAGTFVQARGSGNSIVSLDVALTNM